VKNQLLCAGASLMPSVVLLRPHDDIIIDAFFCRCTIRNDALLEYMQYERPFGTSVAILGRYLGVVHVLTYAAMVLLANREAR
jgi:hypothetical protein